MKNEEWRMAGGTVSCIRVWCATWTSKVKTEVDMNYMVLNREELPCDRNTYEFEGFQYQDTEVSFIWVDMPPGGAVRLHKHPYKEIFILQEGIATFTVDSTMLEAHAGQIIVAPADVPHKFMNTGDRQLKQIDIHISKRAFGNSPPPWYHVRFRH
jgi:mannose-6-phosphate isomerase-like protein (cupin superfamily)